jgi:hypothetical protein
VRIFEHQDSVIEIDIDIDKKKAMTGHSYFWLKNRIDRTGKT